MPTPFNSGICRKPWGHLPQDAILVTVSDCDYDISMNSRFPLGTVAFYGPTDKQATMLVASIVSGEGSRPSAVRKWHVDDADVRESAAIQKELTTFFKANKVVRAVVTEVIVGCPHEEGIDYPRNEECPLCPFWWGRRRKEHRGT